MEISQLSAVVTGGASGLGRAAAIRLASSGARVAILDLAVEQGRQLATEIGGAFFHLDVANPHGIDSALAAAEEAHGVARVLVNSAGVVGLGKTIDNEGAACSSSLIRRLIDVNLVGTLEMMCRFSSRLAGVAPLGEERGVVINVASIAAFDGPSGQLAYAASKGGVVSLTLPAARDLAPYGIRVMTIAPGMYRTNMVSMLDDAAQDRLGREVPFPNRLGRPEEFGHLVASIVENPMLNGEVIRLDGAHRLPAG